MKNKIKITKELRNKMLIVGVSLSILTGVYGTSLASIKTNGDSRIEMMDMLAQKFNLDESEIEDFMEKYREDSREDKQTKMKIKLKKKLQNQVKKGNLSYNQKNLILEKREEMEKKINQDLKNWSKDRKKRREQIEEYREEMRKWAEENNIEFDLLGLKK